MVGRATPKKGASAIDGPPSLEWEFGAGYPRLHVAGVDEVGRGCLAGPVVAAAVVLPPGLGEDFRSTLERDWVGQIHDSKLVKPELRERLAPLIEGWASAFAIGVATVEEIDRINIYHASHLAMRRALEGLSLRPAHLLVDGNVVPKGFPWPGTAIVKGDRKCLSIAAASIVAKVWRDRYMAEMDGRFPGYGFGAHKGYSTPQHGEALGKLGPCELHRRSFAPIAAALGESEALPEQSELF